VSAPRLEAPSHDGALIYASELSPLIRDGAVSGGVIVSRDITSELSAAVKESAATEIFETACSDAPMGVALVGIDGRFLRVNRALCEMLGRGEEEIVGHTSAGFTHPDDLDLTAKAVTSLREQGEPVAAEKRYVRPDGEVVASTSSPPRPRRSCPSSSTTSTTATCSRRWASTRRTSPASSASRPR
jgi:PAS domain S-box-containing protein